MKRVFCAAAIFAMAAFASFAEPRTVTWIGGASGSLFDAANWDPALEFPDDDKNWRDWARITNTVTFTENDLKYFWRNSRLSISGNSTVTFKSRFWTALATYLTADKEAYVDSNSSSQQIQYALHLLGEPCTPLAMAGRKPSPGLACFNSITGVGVFTPVIITKFLQ